MAIQRSGRIRVVAEARTPQLLPSGVLGMLIFVFTEMMLFGGLISAFTIIRSAAVVWPPPGQPRLPVRADRVQHAAAAGERGDAAADAPRLPARPREGAQAAGDRDGARRLLRRAAGRRVGGAAAAGSDAHVEQPRLLLLPDHRPARAARAGRARDPRPTPGCACSAAGSRRVSSRPRRCSGTSSSASGRCSTWWSTDERLGSARRLPRSARRSSSRRRGSPPPARCASAAPVAGRRARSRSARSSSR